MAYSWFSHCEKYLKALEYEKRFLKKQKVTALGNLYFCSDCCCYRHASQS